MEVIKTDIEGVLILQPKVFTDARGYFYESWNKRDFEQSTGLRVEFVQDNESCSEYGVVRGLHFQRGKYWQAKLVRVVLGEVLDVVVDLRVGSPTFGKSVSVILSAEKHNQLFIPKGFAHGFAVLSPKAIFQYKCDSLYNPENEGAILWSDPTIGIDWQVPADKVILSDKDSKHPLLSQLPIDYLYTGR